MRKAVTELPEKKWAVDGTKGRQKNIINSFEMDPAAFPDRVRVLLDKFDRIQKEEVRFEGINLEDASIALIAYGSASRAALTAMNLARSKGMKVGLLRPVTLFPFPYDILRKLAKRIDKFIVAELSAGQLIEDVRIAAGTEKKIDLVARYGGVPMTAEDIVEAIEEAR